MVIPSDALIEASEYLRLAKHKVDAATREISEIDAAVWGDELTRVWLRIASLEEQVEELSYEL